MIIPVALSQNKSPVLHVQHNVCLESWCVKYVYSYAYQKLLEVRKLVSRMKLLGDELRIIKRLLLGAQLINPDVSTFWNMRRELLSEHFLNVTNELKISKLVLTYKSKSNEAFMYRKWLITRILQNEINDKTRVDNLLNDEIQVCSMAAEKSQNNYHAWCHRIWCMENILKYCTNTQLILQHELNFTENWISLHVSEHTGFHYRQYILNRCKNTELQLDNKYLDSIKKLFENATNYTKPRDILIHIFGCTEQMWNEINVSLMFNSVSLLLYDLLLNDELNNLYVDHESIWYHRRYILYQLVNLICSYFGVHTNDTCNINTLINYNSGCNIVNSSGTYVPNEKLDLRGEKYPKMLKCDFDIIKSSNLYKVLLNKEKMILNKKSNSKNRNYDLAKRHEKWLRFILGMNEI